MSAIALGLSRRAPATLQMQVAASQSVREAGFGGSRAMNACECTLLLVKHILQPSVQLCF